MFNVNKLVVAISIVTAPALAIVGEFAHAISTARAAVEAWNEGRKDKYMEVAEDAVRKAIRVKSDADWNHVLSVAAGSWGDEEPPVVLSTGSKTSIVLVPVRARRGYASVIVVDPALPLAVAYHEMGHHWAGDIPRRATPWEATAILAKRFIMDHLPGGTLHMERRANVLAAAAVRQEAEETMEVVERAAARGVQLLERWADAVDQSIVVDMIRGTTSLRALERDCLAHKLRLLQDVRAMEALARVMVECDMQVLFLGRACQSYVLSHASRMRRWARRLGVSQEVQEGVFEGIHEAESRRTCGALRPHAFMPDELQPESLGFGLCIRM